VVTIVRAGLVPEIGVNEQGAGYSRPPRERALARRCIEISLAGLLAEARARREAEIDVLLDAGQPDFRKAIRDASIAAAEEGGNHLSILADAMRIARRVILDYWPVVARLANAVFEYGHMSPDEVAHVAAIHQARASRYSRALDDNVRRSPPRVISPQRQFHCGSGAVTPSPRRPGAPLQDRGLWAPFHDAREVGPRTTR
jgi:hypothetical protein